MLSLRHGALSLLLLAGCASPRAEGRLLSRLAAAQPQRWPQPVPVGEGAGVELTEGALDDQEARALGPHCTQSVRKTLGRVRPARDEDWRVVVSRLVVDTAQGPRGERVVRARAVVEVRDGERSLAAATGVADLVSSRPSFRTAEWGEVSRTVASACAAAVHQLKLPWVPLPGPERERLWTALAAADPGVRTAAVQELGRRQDAQSLPQLRSALQDGDATVRRLAAWSLGELGDGESAEPLGFLAETDPDYAVRVEAVASLGKLLAVDPGRRPAVKEGRQRGRQVRAAAPAPGEAPPREDDPAGRALPLPE